MRVSKFEDPDKFVESEGVKHSTQVKKNATRAKKAQRKRQIKIIKRLMPKAHSILCIGARDDSEVLSFIKAGFYTMGIDVTPESIYVRKMDAHKMTFGKNTFDFIYASHLLEHLHDPVLVMQKIREISKYGIFIMLPPQKDPRRGHPANFDMMGSPPTEYTVPDKDFDAFGPNHKIVHYKVGRREFEMMFTWED